MTDYRELGESAPEMPGPRRGWGRRAGAGLGLAALALVVLWSVGAFRARPPLPGGETPAAPEAPAAGRVVVERRPVAPRVDVVGTVASASKVNLSARLAAYVKEVAVSAGSLVTQGQVLVRLDEREFREQAAAAEAQFRQAEAEYHRARQLIDNQATTEQAFTAAQAQFAAARAQWERSKVVLADAQIVSPMDGVVGDRRVEPGDLAAPGNPLLSVYDPTAMQLEAPVPVRLLARLPIGQEVEVTLDRPAAVTRGRVRQIVSEIDPLSRTQLVKVGLESPSADILPGTFGRLWVPDEPRDAILVPAGAVYAVGQIELVQVVRDGRAVRRAVRTGPRHGADLEILAGLEAGEVVLASPIREVR